MKKRQLLRLAGLVMAITAITGCMTMPIKEYSPLVKTNEIFIGEVKVFKNMEVAFTGEIKNIGVAADNNPYYQMVAREYIANLKTELEKSGFTPVEGITPNYQGLVIKTKIGDYPAPLGGWLGIMAMGAVVAQVEVYWKSELALSFGEAVNTTLGYKAESQIKRHIIPRIVKKLREKFL